MQGHTKTHITRTCRTLPFRNESFHIDLFLKTLLFSHSYNVTQNESFASEVTYIIPATDVHFVNSSEIRVQKNQRKVHLSALQQSCCHNTTNKLKIIIIIIKIQDMEASSMTNSLE